MDRLLRAATLLPLALVVSCADAPTQVVQDSGPRFSHTPAPTTVHLPASFQSEVGCPGDWQPECLVSMLMYDASDDVWQGAFFIPIGAWEYKVAMNGTWDENYGVNASANGPNIPLALSNPSTVKFYYDHKSHWVTTNVNSVIATAAGSFQSELGCPGDWQPECLRSWLQDADGDGIYTFTTSQLPAGSYEVKVAIDESWSENYGIGGTPNGANIPFVVPDAPATTYFVYNAITHVLNVAVIADEPPPTAEDLVDDLDAAIVAMDLHHGIARSLRAKLTNAAARYAAGNTAAACGMLQALLNEIAAQTGKAISEADAVELTEAVEALREAMGCG